MGKCKRHIRQRLLSILLSLLPFTFISYSHLGSGASCAVRGWGVAGLGTGVAEEQSEPRWPFSVPPKDAVPRKGSDLTQHTWLFTAAQVASWCQFYRQVKEPCGQKCQPLPLLKELREACFPTFKGRIEGTEGDKMTYIL